MAPVSLQSHACPYCRRLLIDPSRPTNSASGEEKNFIHFDFFFPDILAGSSDNCSLCTWFLDEEWIHRSATVNEVYARRNIAEDSPERQVLDAVAEASIRQDEWMPPPNPANTLRRCHAEQEGDPLDKLRLACLFHDYLDIKFFGLWDPVAYRMIYRTRNGFSVFTASGNPASRKITTKPIEREAGSEKACQKAFAWLNECLNGQIRGRRIHASCPKPSYSYLPTRLIEISSYADKYEMKVREMKGCATEPYVALSYCWGGDQPMKSTKTLLPKWMIGIPWDELPQTLRDAVIVCQNMGIHYLWVDAFCIVQDDQDDKAVEIAQMPNIYRNSTLTIAASRAGSVQEGFLADRSATEFPNLVFELPYQLRNPDSHGSVTLIMTRIKSEPLDTRGWTLQERLLSPRTLEFGTRQLRFLCQHNPRGLTDGWRLKPEASNSRQDNLQENFDALEDTQRQRDDTEYEKAMENWFRLVKVYTHRRLTLPSDKILAISGIAERYGKVFGDQYCAGIWRSTFARALYWKACGKRLHSRPQAWQGPSWSWTSINGAVEFPSSHTATLVEDEPRVVAIDIELANPDDPYGAILEGSGRLTLKVRKLPAIMSFKEGLFGSTNAYAASLTSNSKPEVFRIGIEYDVLDATQEERDENNAVFLELSSKADDQTWSCKGLIARGDGGDTFTRVGSFNYQTREPASRRHNESLESWQQRVNSELNWFAHCPIEIVDII